MSLLRLEAIACVRGGRLLFDALDLAIERGEAVQVVGPNGCGKSSLLRLAAGLLAPAAGTVQRGGGLALADDAPALDRDRTLAEALSWWARIDRVRPSLEQFGLQALASVPVRLLSTGQLRRANLARVAATGTPLWLLDEPLNGLDREGAALLGHAITQQLRANGAVLAASHVPLPGNWRTVVLG